MGRKREVTDVRVVVEVDTGFGPFSGLFTPAQRLKERRSVAEEMISQIRRHVDGGRYAHVEEDTEDTCEHCGSRWTESSAVYNGGCCDADERMNPEITGVPA